jgi:hypothetical protein
MEFTKSEIASYYDELSRVLTDWETGEISDFELYSFMVDTQNAIAEKLN